MTLKGGEILENINFRGVVYSKYASISDFSRAIGWTRQKGSNIVNGITEPSLDDVDKMSKALNISFDKTAKFFLHDK
jgi:transcriptional regulator with XRE-family HTH domain